MKRTCILLISLFLVATSQLSAQDELKVFLGEDILLSGDYTQLGIYASRDQKPSDVRVAYFELFTKEGLPVVQEMVYLKNGLAEAVLRLPESIQSGYYLFRSYTSDSDFNNFKSFHQSWVAVINPDIPPAILPDSLYNQTGSSIEKVSLQAGKKEKVILDPKGSGKLNFVKVSRQIETLTVPSEVEVVTSSNINPKFKNERELAGHVVKVKGLQQGEHVFLSSIGKVNDLYFGEVKDDGYAYIFMDGEKKYHTLLLQSTQVSGIEIVSPFWEYFPKVEDWPSLQITEKSLESIKEMALQKEVKKHFFLPDTTDVTRVQKIADAYAIYDLDDYNRFESLALTFREYIPEVLIRNKRGKIELRMRTPGSITKENPLVILDGVPIFDIDAISKFDPKDIRRIEVSNRYYKLGSLQLYGIINLYSFNNDFANFPIGSEVMILDYPSPQPSLSWNFPEHSNKRNRSPDFRSLLHWNITQTENKNIEAVSFYTSELEGLFSAEYYSLDDTGKWVKAIDYFEVK
ncbi:hypothetical protein KIH41_17800 [Litoribacter ruber]|uniref:hypothetical protein n=1 Tax=Litoribacter ruber TaxID=702568 RepID=UPI001BDA541B|nr:hypothetical protein [Litoribacter ruber]MBT0813147.1 hypothetical protein [Litoribacter ruber]